MRYSSICKKLFNNYWNGSFYNYKDKYRIVEEERDSDIVFPILVDNYEVGYIRVIDLEWSSELFMFLYDDEIEVNFKKALAKEAEHQGIIVVFRNNTDEMFNKTLICTDDILAKLIQYTPYCQMEDNNCVILSDVDNYYIVYNQEHLEIYRIISILEQECNCCAALYSLNDYSSQYDYLITEKLYYFMYMLPWQDIYSRNSQKLDLPKKYWNKVAKLNDDYNRYVFRLKSIENIKLLSKRR